MKYDLYETGNYGLVLACSNKEGQFIGLRQKCEKTPELLHKQLKAFQNKKYPSSMALLVVGLTLDPEDWIKEKTGVYTHIAHGFFGAPINLLPENYGTLATRFFAKEVLPTTYDLCTTYEVWRSNKKRVENVALAVFNDRKLLRLYSFEVPFEIKEFRALTGKLKNELPKFMPLPVGGISKVKRRYATLTDHGFTLVNSHIKGTVTGRFKKVVPHMDIDESIPHKTGVSVLCSKYEMWKNADNDRVMAVFTGRGLSRLYTRNHEFTCLRNDLRSGSAKFQTLSSERLSEIKHEYSTLAIRGFALVDSHICVKPTMIQAQAMYQTPTPSEVDISTRKDLREKPQTYDYALIQALQTCFVPGKNMHQDCVLGHKKDGGE